MTTEAEAFVVPDTTADIGPVHWVCGVCYPEAMSQDIYVKGLKGVCGADLLGVVAPPGTRDCEECNRLARPHAYTHGDAGFAE